MKFLHHKQIFLTHRLFFIGLALFVLGVFPSSAAAQTTTLTAATNTDPASFTIAPGSTATVTNAFALVGDATDTITEVTIAHQNASSTSLIEIVSDDGATVYGSTTAAVGTSTTITLDTNISVTTATTTYKIRMTPKTHANLPSGNRGELIIFTSTVLDWTGTSAKVGTSTDTAFPTIIDNQSLAAFGTENASSSFADQATSTTGSSPRSVTAADLNNDGYIDLAVVNYLSASVSTFLNNGDGTFADKVDKTTGTGPFFVTTADLNNDGYIDLAVANYSSASVSTFLNNGDGTFADKVDKTTGSNPASVTAADLNNDGYIDLAVANYSSASVSTFLNNGDGTFADKVDKTTGSNPASVTAADLNNDGYIDLAVANYSSASVSTFLNNGDGTFADKVDKTTGSNPASVTAADLNNDGYIDLAVANYSSASVSTFLNNGDGTFADKVDKTTGSNPASVTAADLNNDGYIDLAVANYSSASVSTFLNNGDGTFADKVDKTTGSNPASVTAADLNNDGYIDLAVENQSSNSVSVFLNNSTTTLTATAGPGSATVSYTTPPDSDLDSVVILASTSVVTTAPIDGTTYTGGEDIVGASVACVDSSVSTSTADSCTATGLTGGTPYYFAAFVKDTSGNYSYAVEPAGSPVTPTFITLSGTLYSDTGTTPVTGSSVTVKAAVGDAESPTIYSTTTDSGTGDFSFAIAAGQAPTNWALASSSAQSPWEDIAFGNGRFVAVAGGGSNDVMYSDDGVTWTTVDDGLSADWRDVTFANGRFHTVGPGTTEHAYSLDGINWTPSGLSEANDWRWIVYGPEDAVLLAVDFKGQTSYSYDDGVTWIAGVDFSTVNINDVTYGNGEFIAVEFADTNSTIRAINSSDGVTWADVSQSSVTGFNSIAYGNGRFVETVRGGNPDEFFTRIDGLGVTDVEGPGGSTDERYEQVDYVNGWFVAISNTSTSSPVAREAMAISRDGLAWSEVVVPEENNWNGVASGNGRMVAVSEDGTNRVMYADVGLDIDTPVTMWIDASSTLKATTYLMGMDNTSDVSNVPLYQDTFVTYNATSADPDISRTIVSDSEFYDSADDADILYTTNSLTGSTTLSAGTNFYNATSTTHLDHFFALSGDFTNTSKLRFGEGTLYFNGTTQQTVTAGTSSDYVGIDDAFSTIVITNTSGTGSSSQSVVFTEDFTVADSFTMTASTSAAFPAGATTTIETIDLQGTDTSPVWLRSTTPGTEWYLDVPGSQINVIYVDVSDSNATSTSGGITATNSFDSGNNTNWSFIEAITISGTLYENDGVTPIGAGRTIVAAVGTSVQSRYITTTDSSGNYSVTTAAPGAINSFATTSAPASDTFSSITYGNGRFVALSTDGTNRVAYSDDGVTWTAADSAGQHVWADIVYGNGRFVAVASGLNDTIANSTSAAGRFMYSDDGINWTSAETVSASRWRHVVYADGVFYAYAQDTVATSSDGVLWSEGAGAVSLDPTEVVYADGLWMYSMINSTFSSSRLRYSTNGIDFLSASPPASEGWRDVTYGNGRWVAVGANDSNNRVITSETGIGSWSVATSGVPHNLTWGNVDYVNGYFFALSNEATTTVPRGMYSADGLNWTAVDVTASSTWNDTAYGNGRLVAVGNGGADGILYADAGFGENTPITLFVDENATTSSSTATTLTYGLNADAGTTTVTANLYADMLLLQKTAVGSSSNEIHFSDADVYDNADDSDILFTATTSTTTINADLRIASGTVVYAPQHLVIDGDFGNFGEWRAERGEVVADATWFDARSDNLRLLSQYDTGSQNLDALEMSTDGLYLYVGDGSGSNNIEQYELSAPFDTSSLTLINSSSTCVSCSDLNDMFISADGSHLYISNQDQVSIDQYSLSTPWDITTLAYVAATSTTNQTAQPFGVVLSPDGTKMIVLSREPDELIEYDLTTAWDITSASFVQLVTVDDANYWSLEMSPDGKKVFGYEQSGAVKAYELSTAWDVSTISGLLYQGRFFGTGYAFTFDSTGQNAYWSDASTDSVWRFQLDGNQIFSGTMTGTSTFYDLTQSNNFTLTFAESASTTNTYAINPSVYNSATTTVFNASSTYTFQNIDWVGTSTNKLILRSSVNGSQWYLDVLDSNISVEFIDVQDSHNISAATTSIECFTGCVDSGNNTNWSFTPPFSSGAWTLYDTITIKHENIDASLSDFPVYVDLSDLSSTFWSTIADGGGDIRVTTDAETPVELPREVVSASTTLQTGELHFKASFINKDADTSFRIYYNGTTTGDYATDATYGAENVWSDYTVVWHMDAVAQSDSAGNLPDSIPTESFPDPSVDSNGDLSFDINDSIEVNSSDEGAALQGAYTNWSAMAFFDAAGSGGGRFNTNPGGFNRFQVTFDQTTGSSSVRSGTDAVAAIDTPFAGAGERLVHATYDDSLGEISVYVNGTLQGTTTGSAPSVDWDGWEYYRVQGTNYESRGAQEVKSAQYIKAQYVNLTNPTDFYFLSGGTGSSTLSDHDDTQVNNAFDFRNKTNEPLFAFKLTPESGSSTVTELTLTVSGAQKINVADFSNIRLLRDTDNDGAYDASDTLVTTGTLSLGNRGRSVNSAQLGTIIFNGPFLSTTTQNYLVVADFNAPENGAFLTLNLNPADIIATDETGGHAFFGSVDRIQHSRNNQGGGGGSAAAVGGPPPAGDGVVTGGGAAGGGAIDTNTGGTLIGNSPDFKRPTTNSGSWTNPQSAYDNTDGTYATDNSGTTNNFGGHGFAVAGGNTIEGVAVKMEISGTTASGTIGVQLSWDGGTSWTSTKTSPTLTTSDTVITLGGPSDLWGRSWSTSEFTDGNFVIRLTGNPLSNTVQVDEIQVRVYNQAGGGSSGGGGAI